MTKLPTVLAVAACLNATLAIAEPPEIWDQGGNLGSVSLWCQPKYAIEDNRVPATEINLKSRGKIFYLLANEDLAIWELQLFNGFFDPIAVMGPDGKDWVASLEARLRLAGDDRFLPVEIEVLELATSQLILYRDGNPIYDFEVAPSGTQLGRAEITTPHDRKERTWVTQPAAKYRRSLPESLGPLGALKLTVRVRLPEKFGGGVIHADFYDPLTNEHCKSSHSVIFGRPQTDADIIDDHLVRYRYYMDQGLEDAASFEIKEATRKVPNSITAWTTRVSYSSQVGDFEDHLAARKKLRELLLNLEEAGTYDKFSLLFAKDFVRSIPRLEQELLQKKQDKSGGNEEP